MQRFLRTALFTALVSIALSAPAKPRLDGLTERLASTDFRVRVQAALELGRDLIPGPAAHPESRHQDDVHRALPRLGVGLRIHPRSDIRNGSAPPVDTLAGFPRSTQGIVPLRDRT